jgi:hypothetical protein
MFLTKKFKESLNIVKFLNLKYNDEEHQITN